MGAHMDLREWTVLYVKHKDVFTRKLERYAEESGKLVFHFKDHTMHAYAMDKLELPAIKEKTLVVTLNTQENMDLLVKKWSEFSKFPKLTVVFVNPQKNEKWFIIPHTHAMISDPDVAQGIKSLSENVTLV
jgi:hypothetical protein